MGKRSVFVKVLGQVIGILIFVLLLYIANKVSISSGNENFEAVVDFMNANFIILLLMGVLFFIGELFSDLMFPFNLLAPPSNASGGFILTGFIIDLLLMIDSLLTQKVFTFLVEGRTTIMQGVFWIILIVGYTLVIIHQLNKNKKGKEDNGLGERNTNKIKRNLVRKKKR